MSAGGRYKLKRHWLATNVNVRTSLSLTDVVFFGTKGALTVHLPVPGEGICVSDPAGPPDTHAPLELGTCSHIFR